MGMLRGEKVVYKNPEYDLTLTRRLLSVANYSELLDDITDIYIEVKEKKAWPGILFLVWGGLVFINDVMVDYRGSPVVNHPMFKTLLVVLGAGWLFYRKSTRKHNVYISTEDDDICIANCNSEADADEIVDAINQA